MSEYFPSLIKTLKWLSILLMKNPSLLQLTSGPNLFWFPAISLTSSPILSSSLSEHVVQEALCHSCLFSPPQRLSSRSWLTLMSFSTLWVWQFPAKAFCKPPEVTIPPALCHASTCLFSTIVPLAKWHTMDVCLLYNSYPLEYKLHVESVLYCTIFLAASLGKKNHPKNNDLLLVYMQQILVE